MNTPQEKGAKYLMESKHDIYQNYHGMSFEEWQDMCKNAHHVEDDIPDKIQALIEQDIKTRGVVIADGVTLQDYFHENKSDMSPMVIEQINELNTMYLDYLKVRRDLGFDT
jgi:hypothetical protein